MAQAASEEEHPGPLGSGGRQRRRHGGRRGRRRQQPLGGVELQGTQYSRSSHQTLEARAGVRPRQRPEARKQGGVDYQSSHETIGRPAKGRRLSSRHSFGLQPRQEPRRVQLHRADSAAFAALNTERGTSLLRSLPTIEQPGLQRPDSAHPLSGEPVANLTVDRTEVQTATAVDARECFGVTFGYGAAPSVVNQHYVDFLWTATVRCGAG
ncbi:MAG: hypothetical protein BWY79_00337 [Actinobacteria bacterium ADurb.Bin444]|nr:MAG: hypothetical protein BWY79_00337 [Actinobacteria bacterium ADurb.Bin444]